MLNDRRKRVLRALIEEYVASATPVGSRTLVERYSLGVSPATVRSELSMLEETGFVVQPHVSAGRIPTDTGYRSFVDDLLEGEDPQLDEDTRRELTVSAAELDELIRKTSSALTRLTNCLAVVLAPSVMRLSIKKISLISMGPVRGIIVVVTEDGQVFDRHIEFHENVEEARLTAIEHMLNRVLAGKRSADLRALYDVEIASLLDDPITLLLMRKIAECLEETDGDRVHHLGLPALLAQPEFRNANEVLPIIKVVEDNFEILGLFDGVFKTRDTVVRIGHENDGTGFDCVSVVASAYGNRDSDGLVAIIGPTRMNYSRAIAAVRAASEALDETLS